MFMYLFWFALIMCTVKEGERDVTRLSIATG
jgi:hypothetical protein